MSVVVRFAPSPTGRLHVGNIRVALLNWLFARQQGGRFILRIDDTDLERSTAEYEQGIRTDLTWLGLTWDQLEYQSKRGELYSQAADTLRAQGRLYPCYETAEELDGRRKRLLARGLPPVYDRAALKLTDAERAKLEAEGRRPHWRFKLAPGVVTWQDLARGDCHYDTAHLSDPVLIRGDGSWLYTLPSVVDDIDMGVTHIIRGEDHATNSAVQLQIIEALGGKAPVFAHLPLLTDAAGQGLSKRLGSLSMLDLREQGLEPQAITSLLARLGGPDPVVPCADQAALLDGFTLEKLGRVAPRFDPAELETVNARLLHSASYAQVAARLAALGIDADAPFWEAVRANLTKLADAAEWALICRAPLVPVLENPDFTRQAATVLPPEPWDETTWKRWTSAVSAATGVKGKGLFHPLRLALTGRENGPELKQLLPLIGPERAQARLNGQTA